MNFEEEGATKKSLDNPTWGTGGGPQAAGSWGSGGEASSR